MRVRGHFDRLCGCPRISSNTELPTWYINNWGHGCKNSISALTLLMRPSASSSPPYLTYLHEAYLRNKRSVKSYSNKKIISSYFFPSFLATNFYLFETTYADYVRNKERRDLVHGKRKVPKHETNKIILK